MRKTFEKAKTTTRTHKFPKVKFDYFDNHFEVFPLLVPLAIVVGTVEHYKTTYYRSLEWNETKATKVLDKVLPHVVEWDTEKNAYYFATTWDFSYHAKKYAPLGYKTWAKKFNNELAKFVATGYEHPKYIKTFEEDDWIAFTEK